MPEDLEWVPPGVDTQTPSIARVYDYWLGGTHNFRADQDAARALIALAPNTRAVMRANRDFLARAVRCLAGQGIRQFLDVGSGIPTQGNVHEIAQQADPAARVVYVDIDPVAVAHSRAMLQGNPGAAVIEADVCDPQRILGHATVRRLIDFSQPVGLLMLAVLHFVPDEEDPWAVVAAFRDALPPGSHLVISHASSDALSPETAKTFQSGYNRSVSSRGTLRSRDGVERFFAGFDLLEPGVVAVDEWRPDGPSPVDAGTIWWLGGAGRKNGEATGA